MKTLSFATNIEDFPTRAYRSTTTLTALPPKPKAFTSIFSILEGKFCAGKKAREEIAGIAASGPGPLTG